MEKIEMATASKKATPMLLIQKPSMNQSISRRVPKPEMATTNISIITVATRPPLVMLRLAKRLIQTKPKQTRAMILSIR